MKKLILLVVFTLPLMAQAQPPEGQDWWACQSVQNAGLIYQSGAWESVYFSDELKFVLIADVSSLTTESVYKAGITTKAECRANPFTLGTVSCTDISGGHLFFDKRLGRGAISHIYGGAMDGDVRDTLSVTPFECAKG